MVLRIPWYYAEFIIRNIRKKKARAILGFLGMMVSVSLIVSMNVLIDSLAADSLKLATASAGETDLVFELVTADSHNAFSWALDINITNQLEINSVINPTGWDGSSLTKNGLFKSWFNATELLEIFNKESKLRGVTPRLIIDSEYVRTSSNRSEPFPTTVIFSDMSREDELDIGALVSTSNNDQIPLLRINETYILSSAARSLNVSRGSSIDLEVFPFGIEDKNNRSEVLKLNGSLTVRIADIVKNQERYGAALSNALFMDYTMIPIIFNHYNLSSDAIIANQVVGILPDVGGIQGGNIYNYRDLEGMESKTLEIGEHLTNQIPHDPVFPTEEQEYHIMFSVKFPRVQAILAIAQISTIARVLLDFMGAIALVIGGVLIYSLQTVSVEERIRDFSIMRTVGVKRLQIWIMVAIEGFSIVILGSFMGIFLSLGLASFFIQRFGFGEITIVISEISILTGLIAGLTIGILSSFLPAYRATSTNIVKGLDPMRQSIPEAKFSRERGVNFTLLGLGIMLTITAAIVVIAIPQVLFGGGFIWLAFLIFGLLLVLLIGMDLISVALLIPVMEFIFSLPLELTKRTRKVKDIVVRSLRRNRRRTTATAVMFSLSFAFVFFVGVNLEINSATAEWDAIMANGGDVVLTSQSSGFFFFVFGNQDKFYFQSGFGEQIKNDYLNYQKHRVDSTTLKRYNQSLTFTEVTPSLSYARTLVSFTEGNETKEYDANIRIGDASLFDTQSADIFGISPNFLDVIYPRIIFSQGSIDDVKKIAEGELNTAVISSGLASEFSLNVGDHFRLRLSTFNATYDILDLSVKAILDAAPGFSGFSTGTGFGGSDVWVSQNTWKVLREIIHSEREPVAPFGDIPIQRIFYKIQDPMNGNDPDFELELGASLGEYLSVHYPDTDNDVTSEQIQEARISAASGQALFITI
ncbi:MAG: ABC transporter permease, partial [Candidatus Hodarchaeales archaeon]